MRRRRRRRLRPLRRERPGEPQAARAGLRRPVAGPRARTRPRRPTGRTRPQVPTAPHSIFVWQDGAEGVRGRSSTTRSSPISTSSTSPTRRSPCSSRTSTWSSWRSTRASTSSTLQGASPLGGSLPARHGRQADQRRADHARVLRGRGLRQARRLRPGRIPDHRATRAFGEEDPLMDIPRTDVGWPPAAGTAHQSGVQPRQPLRAGRRRGLQPVPAARAGRHGRGGALHLLRGGRCRPRPEGHRRAADRRRQPLRRRRVRRGRPSRSPRRRSPSPSSSAAACGFQAKVQNADARGYDGVIIFNAAVPDCEAVPPVMTFPNYTGDALSVLVARSVGLRIIGALGPGDPCAQVTPAAPRETNEVFIGRGFDGWGYLHLYDNAGDDLDGRRPLRHRGGHGRALRARLRRAQRARGRHRPDREPRVQLLPRGRPAGALVRPERPGRGRQVRRRGRQRLLGRRDLRPRFRRSPDRGVGPRSRALPVPLHGPGSGGRPALQRRRRGHHARGLGHDPAHLLGRQRQRRSGSRWPRSRRAARSAASPATPWSTPPARASPGRTPSRTRPTTAR